MLTGLDRLIGLVFDAFAASCCWFGAAWIGLWLAGTPERRRTVACWALTGFPCLVIANLIWAGGLGTASAWEFPNVLQPPALSSDMGRAMTVGLRVLGLVYLAGMGLGLGWLAACGVAGWVISRRSDRPSLEVIELYGNLTTAGLGRSKRPLLRIGRLVRQPILLGWIRPTILIPDDWQSDEYRERLRLALLHELAHHEHGDPLLNLWAGVARSIAFGVPGITALVRRTRLDQEILADRVAARGFGGLTSYASTLVGAAASPMAHGLLQRSAVASGVWTPLKERLSILLESAKVAPTSSSPGWRAGVSTASLVAIGLLAPLHFDRPNVRKGHPEPTIAYASLRLARLEVPSRASNQPPFELPIRVGSSFEVDLMLWANRETLGGTRLGGVGIVPPSFVSDEPGWHHVRIRRDPAGSSAKLDDMDVSAVSGARPPEWLTIEPATGTVARFRNVLVRY